MSQGVQGQRVSDGVATIKYGPYTQKGNYAGRTIGDVKAELQGILSMDGDTVASIGKTRINDDHVITEGEEIQLIRRRGEKGIA